MTDLEIPDTGAVFTFGKSRFADNKPSHFFIKNDPVVHIACGDEHTAVICKNGRIFAFGSNEWGQLGLGHNNMVHKPSCIKTLKPERAKYIACGRAHTIILTESNNVYACGSNTDGQLGLDNVDMVNTPTKLPHNILYENEIIHKLSAGSQHSAALTESGKVFVWGSNSEGQLGFENSKANCKQPTLLEFKDKIRDISCGYYHTAVITENGELYIFGENENGKLGISQTESPIYKPTKVELSVPLSTITCGGNHNFGLTEDGLAIAFGSNLHGELGFEKDVSWVQQPTELPAELFNNEKITLISCGESHTAFITESQKIYTCGDKRHGKLCHEEEEENSTDNETYAGLNEIKRFKNYNVTNVSCGGCHTIICAEKNEDELNKTATGTLPPLQRVPNSMPIPTNVDDFITTPENTISESLESGKMNGIENSMDGIKSQITELSKIPDNITDTITTQKENLEIEYDKIVDNIEDKSEGLFDQMSEKLEDLKNGVSGKVENLKSQSENFINESNMPSWIKSPAENALKQTTDGISTGLNKFMDITSDKSLQEKPKFDSVDNLLQEIEDDMCSKSSKTSGDTVSIISNDNENIVKESKNDSEATTNGQDLKSNIEDEDVKIPTPEKQPEKRLTKFFNTFRRKKISSSTVELNTETAVEKGSMDEVKEITTELKTEKTKACIIL